nr:hypothetical protein [Microbacterium barkeri]
MSAVRSASIAAIVYGTLLIGMYLIGGVGAVLATSLLALILTCILTAFAFVVSLLAAHETGRFFVLSLYMWAVFTWGPTLGLLSAHMLVFIGIVALAGLMGGGRSERAVPAERLSSGGSA